MRLAPRTAARLAVVAALVALLGISAAAALHPGATGHGDGPPAPTSVDRQGDASMLAPAAAKPPDAVAGLVPVLPALAPVALAVVGVVVSWVVLGAADRRPRSVELGRWLGCRAPPLLLTA